jgi:hypothetical protein
MLTTVQRLILIAILILPALTFGILESTRAKNGKASSRAILIPAVTRPSESVRTYTPETRAVDVFEPINVAAAARQEALAPTQVLPSEIRAIDPPRGEPPMHKGIPIVSTAQQQPATQAPPPSPTGPSPGPIKSFKAEFLSGTTIPPDTMGAVGTTHVVTPSNNMMRIQTRDGVEVSRMTLNSFWAGTTVKGVAVASAFDTKVFFDRFNSRFILISSLNGPSINSGAGLAVTQTADPTGLWNRYTVVSDPNSTAGSGHAIDYPSVGFNKNWIVLDENTFNYSGSAFTSYYGQQIFVFDKQAAYANTLGSVSLFEDPVTNCTAPFESKLGCGFTMAPAITEDNTTDTDYLVEDWDSTAAQLRLTKITGTAAAPVLTVGTQFPQSPNSWRFDARRIGTTGGYAPQRQQSAYLTSGSRIMANDSRIQNAVFRDKTLWTTHTVMLSTTPQLAGTVVGGTSVGGTLLTRDNHAAVQWWAIDPSIEPATPIDPISGLGTSPIQRARIEDPTADNCHDGNGGTMTTGPCVSTLTQVGQFYVFPNISVNQNNDVLIGFTQFSNLTYPNAAYAIRRSSDPVNTTRDPAVFRPGQANYNIGAGAGGTTARQNRWGDYSAAQTDPLDDTTFWTVQEYAGTVRDFGLGLAGNWETWWAQVDAAATAPSLKGNLIINEFRLRGVQGVRDEFVELYNPDTTPVIVNTTDNSDGWALAFSTTGGVISGVAVVPNGTVISAKGHFLIADNPDAANGPTLVYSLNSYPGLTNPASLVRGADSDTGWSIDLADNGGLALFKTSTVANFTAPNHMDSVGFASTPAGLFKEGTGIPDVSIAGLEETIFRNSSSGGPKDTNDNASDFIFADTQGTLTTAGQHLGAPGPENLDGPVHNTTGTMGMPVFDNTATAGSAPNFVFDPTAVTNGTNGTVTVRRRLVNNTGVSISRVRLRFVDLTTFPQPVGTADLRLLTSTNLTVETPPAQALGGGINASAAPPVVTFAAPIANGANIPIDFLFGVMQTGCFHFIVIAEALPGGANTVFGFGGTAGSGSCAPTAAPAFISGTVTTPDGAPLGGVTINLAGARTAKAITDSNGNYIFSNVDTGNFYTVTPSLINYHFGPESSSFSLVANKTDAVFTATRDALISGNAIDTADFFVRQHYLDFLGREPDESGFNFWSDQVLSCGVDASCIERRRINVSAAYFLSIEFQETGGLVDGLYRASYGRRPLYAEFIPDTGTVAHGVIVGMGDWAGQLEANKQAFVAAWVERPAFQSVYGGLSNASYVDTLISHTGVSFAPSERDALVNGLNTGAATRAEVLRQIAADDRFIAAKRNEAFVLMEYFGYLRRDPDESGYAFWLNKLNQFGGNFEQAEMVKAFIVSSEYRGRFSQ